MADAGETHRAYVAGHGLEPAAGVPPGPVTPLLTKGGALASALRGELGDGIEGVLARYEYVEDRLHPAGPEDILIVW